MITLKKTKLIHVGRYAAEVAVELIDDDTGWAPYLTVEDARKLDRVRELLHYERIDEAKVWPCVWITARALDLKKDNDWFDFKYDHFKNKTHQNKPEV